jgi:glycosyltransferase involved in cell wall biosynthesis
MTTDTDSPIRVSFIIVTRNAAAALGGLFADYAAQDYAAERRELLIVDGMSEDDTQERVQAFRREHPGLAVTLLDNPGLILAAGWNVGLAAARGDILIRVDAHARIPTDFIARNVDRINAGEDICGGLVESHTADCGWAQVLCLADASKFGGSPAGFRNPGEARYVDTLAYAAYRRAVFVEVGGLDERLRRTEDNELHGRMTDAGYKFFYDPSIRSHRAPRTRLMALLEQKLANGLGIGILLAIRPRSCRMRHLIPLGFVVGVAGGLCLLPISPLLLAAVIGPYLLLDAAFAAQAVVRAKGRAKVLAALSVLLFPAMHVAYGIGTLLGLVRMPLFRLSSRRYKLPWPITE